MCKHVLNAQVAVFSFCCRQWFDCSECHEEKKRHPLEKRNEIIFFCKKCRKCFEKYADSWDMEGDSDEYCPKCDNHFVIEAKVPKPALTFESEDTRMDNKMFKDVRERKNLTWQGTVWDPDLEGNKLG